MDIGGRKMYFEWQASRIYRNMPLPAVDFFRPINSIGVLVNKTKNLNPLAING